MTDAEKKLYLSDKDKKIAGLCGGVAEYFETDATLVRLGWVVVTAVTGFIPGVVAYIIGIMIVPNPPAKKT